MKNLMYSVVILLIATQIIAQPRKAKERISTIKKIKLLEILNLDEQSSDKFLAKYSNWENKIEEQMKKFDDAEEKLTASVKSGKSTDLQSLTSNFIKERDKILEIAKERDNDLKTHLTDEQFAKYLIFEKRFRRELGEKIMKRRGKRDK